jgi:hypothetical protein
LLRRRHFPHEQTVIYFELQGNIASNAEVSAASWDRREMPESIKRLPGLRWTSHRVAEVTFTILVQGRP